MSPISILAKLAACSMLLQGAAADPVPAVATNLTAYVGRWYQMYADIYVASTFEKGAYCVTADYRLNDDATVSLFNSQANGAVDGPLDNVTGTAYTTDTPGVLSVRDLCIYFNPARGEG